MPSPVSCLSSVHRRWLKQMAYKSMLSVHPCLTELLIGKICDRKPFICTAGVALLYIFLIRRRNFSLCPCFRSVANK
jgi:hypothetical protein